MGRVPNMVKTKVSAKRAGLRKKEEHAFYEECCTCDTARFEVDQATFEEKLGQLGLVVCNEGDDYHFDYYTEMTVWSHASDDLITFLNDVRLSYKNPPENITRKDLIEIQRKIEGLWKECAKQEGKDDHSPWAVLHGVAEYPDGVE